MTETRGDGRERAVGDAVVEPDGDAGVVGPGEDGPQDEALGEDGSQDEALDEDGPQDEALVGEDGPQDEALVGEDGPQDEALGEADSERDGRRDHAAAELEIPVGYVVVEGAPEGDRRAVGVVVSRFNGGVTTGLLDEALGQLEQAGVAREAVTVMPVPGAFELPLAAMALAKTRRFACIVALGCVIRGETSHSEYVASEAASGLQLAALETGVPVSFGVLTCDTVEQAEARIEKGAEAVRTALEMADVFAQLRAAAGVVTRA